MKIEKIKENIKKGSLVKNIRNNCIGVIVEGTHKSEHSNQYYNVLADGEVVRWFKPNIIEIDDERSYRNNSQYLV